MTEAHKAAERKRKNEGSAKAVKTTKVDMQEDMQDSTADQVKPVESKVSPAPVKKKTLVVSKDKGATCYEIDEADLKTWIDAGYVVKK